jgi:hypothetical protein
MAVDGQLVARTVGELRTMLAEAGDLLAGLQRVVDATRTVVGVDGAGLTLAHEDGPPRAPGISSQGSCESPTLPHRSPISYGRMSKPWTSSAASADSPPNGGGWKQGRSPRGSSTR